MIEKLTTKILMFCLHIMYKRVGRPIMYIKGKDKDFPKYLLYTEDADVYTRMDDF